LDPSNAKAHLLKAQVFERRGQYDQQLAELDKARALGTSDPWLQLGYATYFERLNSWAQAYEQYSQVEQRGPGKTASERKAYVYALRGLRSLPERGEDVPARVRKYAAIALASRYPTDAWTPLAYAEDFIDYQLFDEAIHYSREALKTMDFGAGRLTLAASLYARAAQLTMSKAPRKVVAPFIDEAKKFGFSQSTILEYLIERRGYDRSLVVLEPALRAIIP
jgi:tetratricopeptide (TPR) repeat protein